MTEPRPVGDHIDELRGQLKHRRPPVALDEDPEAAAAVTETDWTADRYRLRWQAMVPSKFVWANLDTDYEDEPEIREPLNEWVAGTSRNLVICGPVGTGKSHAACAASRPFVEQGLDLEFIPVGEMLDLIWSRSDTDALRRFTDVDLLIIDDLGADGLSDWETRRIYSVVNRRWLEEARTIVTANAEPDALEEIVGPRTFSRLVGDNALVLRISGKDRRRARRD